MRNCLVKKSNMLKKYVFAGAANSGKTTLLNEMKKLGFQTIQESARKIIKYQLSINGNILPWINRKEFDKSCFEMDLKNDSEFSDGIVFFDRALPDLLAYHKIYNDMPDCLEHVLKSYYDRVFFLEMLPSYEIDEVRRQTVEMEKRIHQVLKETYEKQCNKMIIVPVISIEERVKVVLSNM